MRIALPYIYRKRTGQGCNPPLALLYLATSLQKNNFEVKVFDLDGFSGGLQEMIAKIMDFNPDVVGIPIFTASLKDARIACQELRKRSTKINIIAGGPHPSACPEDTLILFPEVDFLLRGESDYTICKLIENLQNNTARPEIAGLSYRNGGSIVSHPVGVAPHNLDDIPIPDRKLLWDNYQKGVYWCIGNKGTTDLMITSRGCPFSCNFCFKLESGYRFRSPENIVKELVYLLSLGIKTIHFEDDLFTVNKSRCINICRMIVDAGLKLHLKVRSRVDTIDEEMLVEMRKCGVKAVVYGFESGSQKILDNMNKKTKVDRNYDVIRMTKKVGLQCYADMFIGFPGETPETIAETERFLLKARPTAINIGILSPFPATQVYLEAKKNGTLIGDWVVYGQWPYIKLPWMKDLSTLRKHLKRIKRRFYLNPLVTFNILRLNVFNMNLKQWKGAFLYLYSNLFLRKRG